MRCFVALVFLFVLLTPIIQSGNASRDGQFGKNRKHHQKRTIADIIRNCKHWKIASPDDPSTADILVRLHNTASSTKKMSVALSCSTMRKLREPKSYYRVPAGDIKEVLLSFAVARAHYHYGNEVRKHHCLLSTWTEDARSHVTCKIEIPVWPNGLFYYKCTPYSIGQLEVLNSGTTAGRRVTLTNIGKEALFLINSTCSPTVSTLTHTNKYKRLDQGEDWRIDFPASCDGRLGINYKGECAVNIYHVCLKTSTFIKDEKFHFEDGEIEECEYRKSDYAAYTLHWLPALFGVYELTTAVMIILNILLVSCVITTLILKFCVTVYLHGTKTAKREFRHRFHSIFKLRSESTKSTSAISGQEGYHAQRWHQKLKETAQRVTKRASNFVKSLQPSSKDQTGQSFQAES